MARTRSALFAGLAALGLAAAPASAVIPTGSFEFELDALWLGSGASEEDFCEGFEEGFGGELEDCAFSLEIDGKGKLHGSLAVAARNGDLFVELSGPLKGKLKGDTGGADLSFSGKLEGEAGSDGGMSELKLQVRFEGSIDASGDLNGSWSFKLCPKGGTCLSDADGQGPDALGPGDWTLTLEITDAGDGRLGGEATAVLGGGALCQYTISGKYSEKKDTASLKLSPQGSACDGTSIRLKNVRLAGRLSGDIKYKLFGAKGDGFVESVP
jgi:hypothetical protein